jgi:hypothetical protein
MKNFKYLLLSFVIIVSLCIWLAEAYVFAVIIFLSGIILYGYISSKEKQAIPIAINFTSSYQRDDNWNEKFPPIKQNLSGYWILNPDAPFELTVMSTDKKIVQQIRDLLDNDEIRDYRKEDMLIAIFAEYNIKIKEIEDYKDRYKGFYLLKIEEMKRNSYEWHTLGEKDREDLMFEFRKKAYRLIYENANCNFELMFEYEPMNVTIDDELIKEYGFECMKTYLTYVDNLDKVREIPNDAYSRPLFEKLVELGLAIRGNDLPKEEILSTLTLKELNAIADNPQKEYKRKKQAIEYILMFNNLEHIISNYVSLRSLFKLLPLPQKYSSLNLQDISKTWKYHAEEVKLLMNTYRTSFHSWRTLKDRRTDNLIQGYRISRPFSEENDPCPCGKDRALRKYSKNNPPKTPCHIGCTCWLNKEV